MTNTDTTTRPTAEELNAHLSAGGFVQVTTYTRSTLYSPKHSGWFSEVNGALVVRSGRSTVKLSIGERLLVGIRLGRNA